MLRGLRPFLMSGARVLDFAPAPVIRAVLSRHTEDGAYVGIDLSRSLPIEAQVDATYLPFADNSFDLAISFHVLEHIPDDRAAMRELSRVLMPGGRAIVQVPWRWNVPTEEDLSLTPDERASLYGQSDHLRYYGSDFESRLEESQLHAVRLNASDYLDAHEFERYNVHEMPLWLLKKKII